MVELSQLWVGRGASMPHLNLTLLVLAAALAASSEVERQAGHHRRAKRQRSFPDRSEIFKDRNQVFEDTKRDFPNRSDVFKERNEVFANSTRDFPERNQAFKNHSRDHFKNRNEIFGQGNERTETQTLTTQKTTPSIKETQTSHNEATKTEITLAKTQTTPSILKTQNKTPKSTTPSTPAERRLPAQCMGLPTYSNRCAVTFASADCRAGWRLEVANMEERHFSSSPFKTGYSYRSLEVLENRLSHDDFVDNVFFLWPWWS